MKTRDSPHERSEEAIEKKATHVTAARGVEGLKDAPAPFVLTTSLDDAYVSYELNAYTDRVQEMAALESRLHAAILDRFHEAGVEIMSPQQATLRRAKGPAIPPDGALGGVQRPKG